MQTLKYVGKRIGTASISLSGKPFDNEAFHDFEVLTFKKLFHEGVGAVIRRSIGVFHDSDYKDMPPQFGAFETLLSSLELHKCSRLEITNASSNRNEFLARVQVRIPIDVSAEDKLFTKVDATNGKNYVLVSFYIGLCHEFMLLSKKNDLLERGLQDVVVPGFLTAWRKPDEPSPNTADSVDKAFDPNHAISEIIRHMRLEPRYNYTLEGNKYKERHFFHSPEGFLFRVEIDGYVTTPIETPVQNGE